MRSRLSLSRLLLVSGLVAFIFSFMVGCETSSAFKAGVAKEGQVISARADAYLAADSTLDADMKVIRQAQSVQLRTATAPPITFRPAYDAWKNVRPWFQVYSTHDPALTASPAKGAARTALIQTMDDLIEHERQRRMIWFVWDTPAPIGS
jgi:hypothetical protein